MKCLKLMTKALSPSKYTVYLVQALILLPPLVDLTSPPLLGCLARLLNRVKLPTHWIWFLTTNPWKDIQLISCKRKEMKTPYFMDSWDLTFLKGQKNFPVEVRKRIEGSHKSFSFLHFILFFFSVRSRIKLMSLGQVINKNRSDENFYTLFNVKGNL